MSKKTEIPIPRDLNEAANFLANIGNEQRVVDQIKLRLNERINNLKKKATELVQVREVNIKQYIEGLFAFAESNRNMLTDNGKRKTVQVPTGIFGWRMTPPAVTLRGIEKILKELKARKLNRFIRTKQEVDKEAMLKDSEAALKVPGVTIGQREEFVVKPSEAEVEVVFPSDKLRKFKR